MRRLLAAFCALAAFLPACAFGQAEVSLDRSTVEACYASTPAGQFSPACIGAASQKCQKVTPQGETTLGIASCIQAESGAWDAILNRQYKQTRATMAQTPGLADELLKAQRAWIAFRDAECGLVYSIWIDGSIRVIQASDCVLQMTARRTFELRDMMGM